MAANQLPIFPETPRWTSTQISSAITTRTVTGVTGLALVYTAGADGTRVDSITICAVAATVVGVIRLWKYIGSGDALLIEEILVTAITPSTTVEVWSHEMLPVNWVMPTGQTLYASPHIAASFNVHVRGGDY